MNGCSHDKNIYFYRGLLACKKCGVVFGPQFKIQGNKSNIKNFNSVELIKNKSEFTISKNF
ncbi:MAG: hypothetical protein ACFFDN_07830 [Candidatus Hodarchaeota archaeon]